MPFGEVLKQLRKDKGLTQAELARLTGLKVSAISMYENGNREPNFETLKIFADFFNVDMNVLLGRETKANTTRISSSSSSSDAEPGSFWYRYIPYAVSAGRFDDCAPLDSLPLISIPDVLLGKYARDPRLVMMHVNGESMNRVIENGATIAVLTDVPRASLQNGDIVIACHDGEGYTVKRFYDLPEDHQIILSPDSNDPRFLPIPIPYDTTDDLHIFGKVVMYSVIL